jgi:hypothetical protein
VGTGPFGSVCILCPMRRTITDYISVSHIHSEPMCAIQYYRGCARDRSGRDPLVGSFFLCIAIAGNYYEYDAIAPIADFLRTQRGFTQSQIGMLNAVFSLPNIGLALVGGLLIDRYGPVRVALRSMLISAAIGVPQYAA